MSIHRSSLIRHREIKDPYELARRDATRLVRACRARIACAARRMGGDDGFVLAKAFCEMVLEDSTEPDGWPLSDLLEVLIRSDPSRDRQTERIVRELEAIARRIDAWSSESGFPSPPDVRTAA